MEQKDIDIYEILKGMPDGTPLYTPMCGNVEFTSVAADKEKMEAIWTEDKNGEYSFDKNGRLNVKRRLGCMGCPLKSDNGLSDFKAHPRLVKAWLMAGRKWWDERPNTSCHRKYGSIYELFVSDVFFDSYESTMLAISGGVFNERIDCKKFLEDYFNINL